MDLRNAADEDVCSGANLALVRQLLERGRIRAVMMAPLCSSFSMARNRYPVRSHDCPSGLPNLAERDVQKVEIGNRCLRAAIRIAK
eukprot:4100372-Lingulodinium_polyedra.AAC.1